MKGTADHELELREASPADEAWLLSLRMTTMAGYIEQSGQMLSAAEQRQRVLQDFRAIRIIRQDDVDIGMVKVVRNLDVWHLVQIQIVPSRQRRGIGRRLIRSLLEQAAREGVPVSLHVLKVNPAQRLYNRLGFRIVADRGHSYEMCWQPERHP